MVTIEQHVWGMTPEGEAIILYTLTNGQGAQLRLSNFWLWQSAYSEYYFTDKYWPDFDKQDLLDAVGDYYERERRYGKA